MKYETVSGDTFDIIAHKVYGDSKQAIHIIEANIKYAHIIIFSSGIELNIPEIEIIQPSTLPPWKRGDN